jgi:microcystin-dependent protein
MKILTSFTHKKRSLAGWVAGSMVATASLVSGNAMACPSQPYIGGMCAFAGNFAPRSWAFADGSLQSISQNTAMFALLGTNFGGDGRTTFGLPDLRGRAIVGTARRPGGATDYRVGDKAGAERVTLTVATIPTHSHSANTTVNLSIADTDVSISASLNAYANPGASPSPGANVLAENTGSNVYATAAPNVALNATSIESSANASVSATATTTLTNAGGQQSHENRAPHIAINWIIAVFGTFPSRS